MTIATLSELKSHPLFAAIAELQTILDDEADNDQAGPTPLQSSGMTRSSVHALAFLLLLMGQEDRLGKEFVVQGFNDLAQPFAFFTKRHEALTTAAVDALCADIDWKAIINDTVEARENNTTLRLGLEVPHVNAYLAHIGNVNPQLQAVLIEKQLVHKSESEDLLRVITTIRQSVTWFEPFEDDVVFNLDEKMMPVWEVPKSVFLLSDSLKNKIRHGQLPSGHYGHFDIIAGNPRDVRVYIQTENVNADQKLTFAFDEYVNTGIYKLFSGTRLAGMYLPVQGVAVKLVCEADVDKVGARVMQEQIVEMLGCSMPSKQKPTCIFIDPVLYFKEAGIQVSFAKRHIALSDLQTASPLPLSPLFDFIHLRTQNPAQWVTCFPATFRGTELTYQVLPALGGAPDVIQHRLDKEALDEERYQKWRQESSARIEAMKRRQSEWDRPIINFRQRY